MESDSFALRTAVFVIAAGALLALSIALFRETSRDTLPYLVFSNESVLGLDVHSRVYYKGVEVGLVSEITFAKGDYNQVEIRIDVDRSVPLGQNTYAQLVLRGITGEFDLTLDNDGELGAPLTTSKSAPAAIPVRPQYILQLGQSLEAMLEELRALSKSLRQLTDEENQETFRRLLAAAADSAEGLVGLEQQASETLAKLPATVRQLSATLEEFQLMARAVNERTGGLEELLKAIKRTADTLNDVFVAVRGDTLVDVDDTLLALRVALRELAELADALRRDPQSLLLGPTAIEPGPGETLEPLE